MSNHSTNRPKSSDRGQQAISSKKADLTFKKSQINQQTEFKITGKVSETQQTTSVKSLKTFDMFKNLTSCKNQIRPRTELSGRPRSQSQSGETIKIQEKQKSADENKSKKSTILCEPLNYHRRYSIKRRRHSEPNDLGWEARERPHRHIHQHRRHSQMLRYVQGDKNWDRSDSE